MRWRRLMKFLPQQAAVRIDSHLFDLHGNTHQLHIPGCMSGFRVTGMLVCCGDMELVRRAA